MSKNLLVGLGFFLAIVIIGFFLVGGARQKNTSPTPVSTGPVVSFNVSAKEYAYTPSTITVNKGDNVKIVFTNNGTTAHNFTISEFNVASKSINPGETDTVTFVADKSGTFKYFCSIDSHRSLGLEGTLTVK